MVKWWAKRTLFFEPNQPGMPGDPQDPHFSAPHTDVPNPHQAAKPSYEPPVQYDNSQDISDPEMDPNEFDGLEPPEQDGVF